MEQVQLLRHTLTVLERLGLRYALVGSYGSSVFGEPRFTRDIDILVELPEKDIPAFCAAFPEADFYFSEPAIRDAVRKRSQFNLLHPVSGNKVVFMLPRLDPWGSSQLTRARRVVLQSGLEAFVSSPEDVIVGKLWYFSEGGGDRHLRDIAGILRISREQLDRKQIEQWATDLGYLEAWRQASSIADNPDANKDTTSERDA